MRSGTWKVAAVVVLAAVFSLNADAPAKNKKKGSLGNQSSQIQVKSVTPLRSNIDLPPGPRTGQYYLTSSSNGYANGVHNLGIIRAGQRLTIYVEGLTTGFDPIVIITAPNWARNDLIVWEADDTDSDPDPAFYITAPVSGVYTMLVAEYSQKPGWYRYSMEVE